jgi:hypothetical protein
MTLALVIVACILFLISSWNWPTPPINLVSLGLFFFSLSFIWGKF